jgi:hypothetical protein
MVAVYRAPMRSRRDDVDVQDTLDRAMRLGVCGFGGDQHDERVARRIRRFADAAVGSLVWTRDAEGLYWLGRIEGPYFHDDDGAAVDLVHVRQCHWLSTPLVEAEVPAAVVATFGRGGRNFQQTHDARVGPDSERIWNERVPRD